MEIKGKVSVADLVTLTVNHVGRGHMMVDIIPLDKSKRVVFDPDALKAMNEKIVEKVREFDIRDPRAKQYIEEFVWRMLPEMDRCGLMVVEDIPEAPDDPYQAIRRKYEKA